MEYGKYNNNVIVYKMRGDERLYGIVSDREYSEIPAENGKFKTHAEWIFEKDLESRGFKPEDVEEVFSEIQTCTVRNQNCQIVLNRMFKDNPNVKYTVRYKLNEVNSFKKGEPPILKPGYKDYDLQQFIKSSGR